MSWNNITPYWVLDLLWEEEQAMMLGCLKSEWVPEWSKAMPDYLVKIKQSWY